MQFHKIIGKIDPKIVKAAEKNLSLVFLELGIKPENYTMASKLGGNPLIFSLIYPMRHIATTNIPTAGTDGLVYYWNPEFILSLDLIGLRLVCEHESWHAVFMHPTRLGRRDMRLWNIAVDFIVNYLIMDGLKKRNKDAKDVFTKHLGKYITLSQTIEHFKHPDKPIPGVDDIKANIEKELKQINLPKPDEDIELTPEQIEEVKRILNKSKVFYADPDLPENLLRPEKIYDLLHKAIPKCSKCGRLGAYKKKGKVKHTHHKCPCDECCGDNDIFSSAGDTVDDHMPTKEEPEKLAKRIADAARMAKAMGGDNLPAELERELGLLTEPKIRWQDFTRAKMNKSREGNSKNDWSRFRTRALASGMLLPKRKNNVCNFGVLLDTSGSMGPDDMSYALSQLIALDGRGEGNLVFCDCEIHWAKMKKLKNMRKEELAAIKPVGGGGTRFAPFFTDYKKHMGNCDFLMVLTDCFLIEDDIIEMRDPKIPVYWVCTSDSDFKPPFGKVFRLNN